MADKLPIPLHQRSARLVRRAPVVASVSCLVAGVFLGSLGAAVRSGEWDWFGALGGWVGGAGAVAAVVWAVVTAQHERRQVTEQQEAEREAAAQRLLTSASALSVTWSPAEFDDDAETGRIANVTAFTVFLQNNTGHLLTDIELTHEQIDLCPTAWTHVSPGKVVSRDVRLVDAVGVDAGYSVTGLRVDFTLEGHRFRIVNGLPRKLGG